MKNSGCENVDRSFTYYKDYNNGTFSFKVYVFDMIVTVNEKKRVIRQFIAYFIEPKMHDFYQLTLFAGPFIIPTKQLKLGVIDLENDRVTLVLNNLMRTLLDNLKYKNQMTSN